MTGEGADLWKRHFAPTSKADKVVKVPLNWVNFITLALLTPDNFDWAKSLLNSKLWHYIIEGSSECGFKDFVVPDKCLSGQEPVCKMQGFEEEVSSAPA